MKHLTNVAFRWINGHPRCCQKLFFSWFRDRHAFVAFLTFKRKMTPGSFTQIYLHFVFAVKFREALLQAKQQKEVFPFIAGLINSVRIFSFPKSWTQYAFDFSRNVDKHCQQPGTGWIIIKPDLAIKPITQHGLDPTRHKNIFATFWKLKQIGIAENYL